jgi:uncharacterized protein (TIGR03435 family)
MMRQSRILAIVLLTSLAGIVGVAQAFEVASVKHNKSAAASPRLGFPPGGRFTATSAAVRQLIMAAYGTPDPLDASRLIGGPGWIDSDRFDIEGRAAGNAPPQERLLMLRSLLQERFKLAVHNETREMPVYALVQARTDGNLGPQLKPHTRAGSIFHTDVGHAFRPARQRGPEGPHDTRVKNASARSHGRVADACHN